MTVRRLFVIIFVIALFTIAVRETTDPDLGWHLKTGEYILESGIPRHDPFSFTVPDHAWTTHEWLSEVFMVAIYRLGGFKGLMLVFAGIVALTFWLVYARCVGQPYLAAFVTLLAAIASAVTWGSRPQMFNSLFLAAFVYIVEGFRDKKGGKRGLLLLPVLTAVWVNLHSGYLLGVVFLAVCALGEAAQLWIGQGNERGLDWSGVRWLGSMTGASFVAAVLNPNGWELWIYPFFTLGSGAMQTYIQEWQSPSFHELHFWPFGAMLAAGVAGWTLAKKRPTWTELLLFLGTGAAGLLSARHIPIFAIVAAPIVARYGLNSLEGTRLYPFLSGSQAEMKPARLLTSLNWLLIVLLGLAAVIYAGNKLQNNDAKIAAKYPVAAVDFLEQNGLATARGYNSYNWGGYLIWRGIPVFVDGRADVYGDEFLFDYLDTYQLRPNWRDPLDEFEVDYVLMERNSPLNTLLAASGEWEEIYADDVAQVFVRSKSDQ